MKDGGFTFPATGTTWKIDIFETISPESREELFSSVRDRVEVFELTYSRFRADSLLSRIAEKAGEYVFPADANRLFDVYRKAYDLTHSLVTPLIGKVLVDAGYDAQYSLEKKTLSTPPAWDDVMSFDAGTHTLHTQEPVQLDFGAGGKGYIIDIVGELIESHGIGSYCVDAGGDMRYRMTDGQVLRVGLENPLNAGEVVGVAELLNKSLCGSAGSRRKWADMHHIVSPKTLKSPEKIISVWTVADTTLEADILTTCLFLAPADLVRDTFYFEYVILHDDFSVEKSVGFPGELFLA